MGFLDEEIGKEKKTKLGLFDESQNNQRNLLKEAFGSGGKSLKQKAKEEKMKSKKYVEDYKTKEEYSKYKKLNTEFRRAKRKEDFEKLKAKFRRKKS